MTNQKPMWTPEPWSFGPYCDLIMHGSSTVAHISAGGDNVPGQTRKENRNGNGNRIVQCVNSLAGIRNPTELVEATKELLESSKESLRTLQRHGFPSDVIEELSKSITRLSTALGGE